MMLVDKSSMDLVLVPCGLAIMVGYHLMLLHRILRHPHTTVIGYENHNKLAWVERMLQAAAPEESALALGVISDNISAATTLASLCIALGSADRRLAENCVELNDHGRIKLHFLRKHRILTGFA
ncbi:hypothetical protein OsJ_28888 [Oryza sativa Japonica Group]|uniref:Uncharacterized protein n=1 Tax=Oryza sativa subsp. japonica TaxID=39947 RepID=B9G2X2_ORYSJ|nr:hypothetical protein OsJ_28888 [Oryza sativa Japonica Group]